MCYVTVLGMHGQNVEFGNLIPWKLSFWREIFAILDGKFSIEMDMCVYLLLFFLQIFLKMCKQITLLKQFFPALVLGPQVGRETV